MIKKCLLLLLHPRKRSLKSNFLRGGHWMLRTYPSSTSHLIFHGQSCWVKVFGVKCIAFLLHLYHNLRWDVLLPHHLHRINPSSDYLNIMPSKRQHVRMLLQSSKQRPIYSRISNPTTRVPTTWFRSSASALPPQHHPSSSTAQMPEPWNL